MDMKRNLLRKPFNLRNMGNIFQKLIENKYSRRVPCNECEHDLKISEIRTGRIQLTGYWFKRI